MPGRERLKNSRSPELATKIKGGYNLPGVDSLKQCLGCGDRREEIELMRIVNNKGELKIDPGGRLSGRDVYICPQVSCFQAARKDNQLSEELHLEITEELFNQLLEEINHG